jgi:hypothetical protein
MTVATLTKDCDLTRLGLCHYFSSKEEAFRATIQLELRHAALRWRRVRPQMLIIKNELVAIMGNSVFGRSARSDRASASSGQIAVRSVTAQHSMRSCAAGAVVKRPAPDAAICSANASTYSELQSRDPAVPD